ncbi:uncharacterized protein LOC124279573 isoform X2 [Haliotis rubra]|uniref:uncharacterized protein LOC124279573 isoform X2 n=1 Tax=Haliotis rubra TaxID=36100 RepID=UPI001EE50AF9|nr:uncharacterized protein LOC124279573 isoform X2 [Haliotis rubra]
MAAINTRAITRIGWMLMLTVCFIRVQGDETVEEDDQYAEYMDLMTSCKFPKFSNGYLLSGPSAKPFYEVCKDSRTDRDLSLLCRNMIDLTLYMCNQTIVNQDKRDQIDKQMTVEFLKYDKEKVPFCTRRDGNKNASELLSSFLPPDVKCEVSCKKDTSEKLCEFIYVSIIAYETILATEQRGGGTGVPNGGTGGPNGGTGVPNGGGTGGPNGGTGVPNGGTGVPNGGTGVPNGGTGGPNGGSDSTDGTRISESGPTSRSEDAQKNKNVTADKRVDHTNEGDNPGVTVNAVPKADNGSAKTLPSLTNNNKNGVSGQKKEGVDLTLMVGTGSKTAPTTGTSNINTETTTTVKTDRIPNTKGHVVVGETVTKKEDGDFRVPGDGQTGQPVVHADTGKSLIKKLEKEYDAPSSGNFMAYFLTAVVLCIAGYVVFHNKQKIIAFIIEGRSGRGRRRTNGGAEYKKLQSNVEESV